MAEERDAIIRTLGEYIDSGQRVVGSCFESATPITSHSDRRYRVNALPAEGEKYMEVIPLGDSGRPMPENPESGEPVSVLLWQHRGDQRLS